MTTSTLPLAPTADQSAAEADYVLAGQIIAAARRCLVCGGAAGDTDECDGCTIRHDVAMRRAEDQ